VFTVDLLITNDWFSGISCSLVYIIMYVPVFYLPKKQALETLIRLSNWQPCMRSDTISGPSFHQCHSDFVAPRLHYTIKHPGLCLRNYLVLLDMELYSTNTKMWPQCPEASCIPTCIMILNLSRNCISIMQDEKYPLIVFRDVWTRWQTGVLATSSWK
jgi:hypothetical protein